MGLIRRELLIIEAERLIYLGYIELDMSIDEQTLFYALRDAVVFREGITPEDLVSVAQVYQFFRMAQDGQRLAFRENPEIYFNAVIADEQIIFYRPNADVFYVKQIFIPFNDYQNAESVTQIFNDVSNCVRKADDSYEASRIFKNLMVAHSSSFVREYAITPLGPQQFFPEFYEEAIALKDRAVAEGRRGGILSQKPILGEDGWYILFLFDIPRQGSVSINDFENPLRGRTFRDIIRDELLQPEIDRRFDYWQVEYFGYHLARISDNNELRSVTIYRKNFLDLFE